MSIDNYQNVINWVEMQLQRKLTPEEIKKIKNDCKISEQYNVANISKLKQYGIEI